VPQPAVPTPAPAVPQGRGVDDLLARGVASPPP
jgi:hypothetical protein